MAMRVNSPATSGGAHSDGAVIGGIDSVALLFTNGDFPRKEEIEPLGWSARSVTVSASRWCRHHDPVPVATVHALEVVPGGVDQSPVRNNAFALARLLLRHRQKSRVR